MRLNKVRTVLLAVVFSLVALVAMSGPWGAAPALAEIDPMGSGVEILIFDDDQITAENTNGGGTLAQGTHDGSLTCKIDDQICQEAVQVALDYLPPAQGHLDIEYRFQSLDDYSLGSPKRMVVTGTGDIFSGGQRDPFTFRLTIEDTGNGRLLLTYEATNPLASLQLEAPGYLGPNP